ncbi:MAG: DinB family protein [Gemmatimonadales bacterium]
MQAKQALKSQYSLFYHTVAMNTEGMTHEDSMIQPAPAGNCANWILGHLVGAQNMIMDVIGEVPVWESDTLANAGGEPITDESQAIDWDTARSKLLGSQNRCLAAIENLTDEQLDKGGYSNPLGGEITLGGLINFFAYHQAYHAGQLGISRRLAGYESAINPEREKAVEKTT